MWIGSSDGEPAYADITSSFHIQISLTPSLCLDLSCQALLWIVDFGSRLQLAMALRGLSLEMESTMGLTGPESLLWSLQIDLGITLKGQFIFAMPFGRKRIATGERIPVVISPGHLLFVREEVRLEHTIGGVTLESLLVFEDVTFPSPLASPPASYSHHDQNFGFGIAFILEGHTNNGARFESLTHFCLDATKRKNIIRRSFAGKVCDDRQLNFTAETLRIRDLPLLAGLWSDHTLECTIEELPSLDCRLTSDFQTHWLSFLWQVSTELDLAQLLSGGGLQGAELKGTSGPLTLEIIWDEMLALRRVNARVDWASRSGEHAVAWRLSGTLVPDSGLTRLKASLVLQRAGFMLQADATFSQSETLLKFAEGEFSWMVRIEPFIDLGLSIRLASNTIKSLVFDASVSF